MSYLHSLKVPPPAVVLVMAVFMWLISRLHHRFILTCLRTAGSPSFFSVGFLTGISGVVTFRRAKHGRPDEASRVVVGNVGCLRNVSQSDVLGRSHHVTWLGSLLVERPCLLVSSPLYVLYINRFQIAPEERALTSLFGNVLGLSSARSTMVVRHALAPSSNEWPVTPRANSPSRANGSSN